MPKPTITYEEFKKNLGVVKTKLKENEGVVPSGDLPPSLPAPRDHLPIPRTLAAEVTIDYVDATVCPGEFEKVAMMAMEKGIEDHYNLALITTFEGSVYVENVEIRLGGAGSARKTGEAVAAALEILYSRAMVHQGYHHYFAM